MKQILKITLPVENKRVMVYASQPFRPPQFTFDINATCSSFCDGKSTFFSVCAEIFFHI